MLTARHCKQKACYIRKDVLEKYGLLPYVEKKEIRLSWKEIGLNKQKRMSSSMFRVVSGTSLAYDVAVSKTWKDDKSDDEHFRLSRINSYLMCLPMSRDALCNETNPRFRPLKSLPRKYMKI